MRPDPSGARPGRRPRAFHRPGRAAVVLSALAAFALLLRLPTAGAQSFWLDETYTGRVVDGSIGHAWSTLQRTENTPPGFYLLEWSWSRLFGTTEIALRSLSAVAGALAVVPVALLASRTAEDPPGAADHRAARVGASAGPAAALRRGTGTVGPAPAAVAVGAAALLAVNPLAHWYSQEARSYGLFLLASALAWVALLAAVQRPTRRRLWTWAVAAAAVTWIHYFGALLLVVGWAAIAVAEAGSRDRRERLRALRPMLAPAGLCVVAVAPLLVVARNQFSTSRYEAIADTKSLVDRVVETPKQFAIGFDPPGDDVLGGVLIVVLAVLVVAGAWPHERRPTRATAMLALALCVWIVPLAAAGAGFDVVQARNSLVVMPPLVVLAVLGARRIGRPGRAALGAVAVVQLAAIVAVAVVPADQRDDWRGALHAAGRGVPGPQLLLIGRYEDPSATWYAPTLRPVPGGSPVVVRSAAVLDRSAFGRTPGRLVAPDPPPGFLPGSVVRRGRWRLVVWRAPRPTAIRPSAVPVPGPPVHYAALVRP